MMSLGLLEKAPDVSILQMSSDSPIRAISRLGRVDEVTAIKKIAESMNISYYDLQDTQLLQSFTLNEFTNKMDPRILWKHKAVPLFRVESAVIIAFANPLDSSAIQEFQFLFSEPMKIVISEETKITRLLESYFPLGLGQRKEANRSVDVEVLWENTESERNLSGDAKASPAVEVCNRIIYDSFEAEASDIHLEPTSEGLDVRIRVDGILHNILKIPTEMRSRVISRFKIISGMNITERRRPQDGKVRVRMKNEIVNLRVSAIPASDGEKMVLRLLRLTEKTRSFPQLGFPSNIADLIKSVLDLRGKMILVTGPTGSGKSTTIYGFLEYLKDGTTNIETVEDPIEYRITGINQIQVNAQVGVNFASALRSILRQDPDVIMIGEIRDKETAEIAFQAAQTGHLVVSTLHTNDACSAVSRLMNLGLEPYVIASSLAGVLAQRLVRTLCSHCAAPADKDYVLRHSGIIKAHNIPIENLKQNAGCSVCANIGFKGREGIFSYLHVTPEIAELIHVGSSVTEIASAARKTGLISLHESALDLVKEGRTTLDEIRVYLDDDSTTIPEKGQEKLVKAMASHTQRHTSFETLPQRGSDVSPQIQVDQHQQSNERISQNSQRVPAISMAKILIMEDDPALQKLYSSIFKCEMFDVVMVSNGQLGLQTLYEFQPDIILCDLEMPIMSGKEFLLRKKSNKQLNPIPVVILTASDGEENEIDLLELGASDFISKASSQKVMLSRIRKVLNQYHS